MFSLLTFPYFLVIRHLGIEKNSKDYGSITHYIDSEHNYAVAPGDRNLY